MSAVSLISLTAPVGPEGAPVVVLGPSLGTSTIVWDDVVPLLVDEYRVVGWDLPGHGAGPITHEAFTVGDLADAVAAAVPDDTFFYAGVSLGAATGLELARRHGDRVRAAAIVASGAQLSDPEAWHDRAAQVRAQSTSSLISASAQRWFAPGSIERRPELTGRLLHALQDADDDSYARCCEALAGYDVRSSLGEITVPVLAAWGAADAIAPETKAAEIAEGVKDGRTARIDDAGHLPPAEQPEAVAALLRSFFASTSGEGF
ncbi:MULTISPECIES: alpha/beta fold hydrolase [Microbacterium]|jgi:3-oxoadipate enol-lactonase|uniref:alpha/beta fold hydrolase n=1 Tax=Microbacterium TaxID=33882 RepID=UPI0023D9B9F4|nr:MULTISPECIES: alpha/beta fold hydrolase [Microbacterium]MDF2048095.1 alpha/beta fold hydrolase [Microbacterium sp. Kw_RZR3]MDF2919600.1 putative hydrolase or acyltransferase [Microbacterium sp.]MDQ1075199.1 3-oxoadipate enol-lactonase [Microbacterium sp. SORGH_AS_0969]MDQ1115430.1 3-oxoadipate enol-lactonase [Microbacterium testaceum]